MANFIQIPDPSKGIPLNWNIIGFLLGNGSYTTGVKQSIEGILSGYGDNFIVSGLEYSAPAVQEGWVFLDGELLKVDGYVPPGSLSYYEKSVETDTVGNTQDASGGSVNMAKVNKAVVTSTPTNLEESFTGNPERIGDKITELLGDWSETSKGVAQIATTAEAEAATDDTKGMTPAKVVDTIQGSTLARADTSNFGVNRLSTDAELKANTTNRVVTPSNFNQSWTAATLTAGSGISTVNSGFRYLTLGDGIMLVNMNITINTAGSVSSTLVLNSTITDTPSQGDIFVIGYLSQASNLPPCNVMFGDGGGLTLQIELSRTDGVAWSTSTEYQISCTAVLEV